MNNYQIIQELGKVIACLQNLSDKKENVLEHYDCVTEILKIQRELKRQQVEEISVSWCIEDVKSLAEDFTDKECKEVLQRARDGHDATIGINWDVLEVYVDQVREERVSSHVAA